MRRPGIARTAAAVTALALAAAGGGWASAARPQPSEASSGLAIERVEARPDGFEVAVRNAGRTPQALAEVIVNDAVWPSQVSPTWQLDPGEEAHATLYYHWISGEPYEVKVVGSRGAVASGRVTPGEPEDPPAWPWGLFAK